MGCNVSAETREAGKHNREVEKALAEEFNKENGKIKLLLLGAGESGKSTVFKQMKLLYGDALSADELRHYTQVVYSNVLVAMKALCSAVENFGYYDELNDVQKNAYESILECGEFDKITPDLGEAIKSLWQSEPFQKAWERRSEFQVVETHKIYLNEIDHIAAEGYVATQRDVIFCRVRTSGIVTERYNLEGTLFEMYDVGGQRNERKKWIHCFEGVTSVIFVAAISEYDQVLYEDSRTNRMVEAIQLFEEVCNNRYFDKSSIILFLNKRDLFAEKVSRVDIRSIGDFVDFEGASFDYEAGVDYFLDKFLAVNQSSDRKIFHHVTCATDTENVQFVWNSCKEIILKENLKASGFM